MRRRAQQIASTMQRELQKVIAKGFNDPRIRGLITVTKVEMTDDLKNAKAYISVMPAERAELTMHGIKAASKRIRRDVMERIHLKEMPALRFEYDHGMREQQVISDLLASDPFRKEGEGDAGVLVEPLDEPTESIEHTHEGTHESTEDGESV